MKSSRCFPALAACLACWLAGLAVTPASAQSANDGFDPNVDGPVWAMALQADGKILVGGDFDRVGGVLRENLARLNVDGTLDLTFTPSVDSEVECLAIQPDGKILVGGDFELLGGVACEGIARLLANGQRDPGFNACADNEVDALAVQPDGRVIAGGRFTAMNGVTRRRLARLWADGSLDGGFNPGVGGYVYALLLQPDGRIVVGGNFMTLGEEFRLGLGRLNADGSVDTGFAPNLSGNVECLARQVDGKLLVGGYFNSVGGLPRLNLVRLNPNGTVDPTFQADANDLVTSLAVQPDGKILVGGWFTTLGGQSRQHLGRLNPDGGVDSGFTTPVTGDDPFFEDGVESLLVQADGKIVAGGVFNALGGMSRTNLGRLYTDGSVDATIIQGIANGIYSLLTQPDGKVLVGGSFPMLDGQPRTNIGRLNADGSLDAGFNGSASGTVISMALQTDGKILVGGGFNMLNGQPRSKIGRLNEDGSLDTTFNPSISIAPPVPYAEISSVVVQIDGKILVGGYFTALGGQPHTNIGRLNANGSVDETFYGGATCYNCPIFPSVRSQDLQADGKILVVGYFNVLSGRAQNNVGRLNTDGSVDLTFNPPSTITGGARNAVALQADGRVLTGGLLLRFNTNGTRDVAFPTANGPVLGLSVQTGGKILVAGSFTSIGGKPRNGVARLNPDGSVDETFAPSGFGGTIGLAVQADGKIILASGSFSRLTSGSAALQSLGTDADGTSVIWSRSGTGPEVEQVLFERSDDGTNFTLLGSATRINGGWKLSGLLLPSGQKFTLRARGRTRGGYFSSSSGLIESVAQFYRLPPPFLSSVQVLGGGAFQFSYTNTNATAFTVLASTNVSLPASNWTVLGTPVPVGNGLYQFTDPAVTNHARRFYQLRSPQPLVTVRRLAHEVAGPMDAPLKKKSGPENRATVSCHSL